MLTVSAAEPGVDALLVWKVVLGDLTADMDGIGAMNDVPHMPAHVNTTRLAAVIVPVWGRKGVWG